MNGEGDDTLFVTFVPCSQAHDSCKEKRFNQAKVRALYTLAEVFCLHSR